MKKVYILEQLGCANCGAKIERDVSALENVDECVLAFPTKQLRISTSDDTGLRDKIEAIARTYESDITVVDRDAPVPMDDEEDDDDCCCGHEHEHEHHHEHGESCSCGHDHEHEHHHEHGESCSRGHDHEHEHHHEHGESCSCGHDHEHEHHHEHGESCSCGHDHEHEHHHEHGESCSCGHDHEHEHHHEHGESCSCGHDHEHEHHHEHGESCSCGHDHEHEHHHEETETPAGAVRKVYILESLGCANCGAKIEREVSELPNVTSAVLAFPTKQLRVTATDTDGLQDKIQQIARSYESEITVKDRDALTSDAIDKVYLLQGLCCANCGAKIERAVGELDMVQDAVLAFPTKQLRVKATHTNGLREKIEEIARGIESAVEVIDRDEPISTEILTDEVRHPEKDNTKSAPKQSWLSEHKPLVEILCGALFFAAGLLFEHLSDSMFVPSLVLYIIAYVILGRKVVLEAVRHLTTGLVFDESFLMTIATLGAFAIREYPEAVGVMLFFQIGEYFEAVAVEKSRSQIMDAVDLRPEVVTRERDGKTKVIPAANARVGDILIVHPGDRVPLDGTILSGRSYLDTSAITGEPVPVRVAEGDAITSGCVNTEGLLRMRVDRPLAESMVTRILDSVENAAASKPKIDRFITRFSRVYTPFVVALAALVAIVPSIATGNWHHWVYTALTFLVISCPCALVLSVPLAFFSGIGAGSKKGILFKGGVSLEALNNVKAAVMDKTGTLTHGTFTVTSIEPNGLSESELLRFAASCEQNSTHPIALSILNSAKEQGIAPQQPDSVQETAGHGLHIELDGHTILCGNAKLMQDNGISMPSLSDASGSTEVLLARDGSFIGRLLLSDTLKEHAAETVSALKSKGIVSAILTGDSQASAAAMAAKAGIGEVHAQLLPHEKLEHLSKLRETYGPVLFVGDGINDAPVLAGADVGAAMGSGADAAIEAADVVFLTSELNAIPQAIQISKTACAIAMQNVVFALAVKALVMILGLFGIASMWLAVFADTGVALLCVLNSIRVLYQK